MVVVCVLLAAFTMQLRLIDKVIDWSKAGTSFNLDGILALLVLVPVAATVFARCRYHESLDVRHELARLSLHDALTGSPKPPLPL